VPTACDLAGANIPDWVDGVSIRPLVNGEVESLHEELIGEITYHASYEPTRSIRTRRFKYIRRHDEREKLVLPNIDDTPSKDEVLKHGLTEEKRNQEMLYDLFFDPDEVNNLLDSPAHTSILDDLRARLDRYMSETDDPLVKGDVPPPKGAMFNDVDGFSPREETLVNE
jgi:arylsulfatase A-like enzyme